MTGHLRKINEGKWFVRISAGKHPKLLLVLNSELLGDVSRAIRGLLVHKIEVRLAVHTVQVVASLLESLILQQSIRNWHQRQTAGTHHR